MNSVVFLAIMQDKVANKGSLAKFSLYSDKQYFDLVIFNKNVIEKSINIPKGAWVIVEAKLQKSKYNGKSYTQIVATDIRRTNIKTEEEMFDSEETQETLTSYGDDLPISDDNSVKLNDVADDDLPF